MKRLTRKLKAGILAAGLAALVGCSEYGNRFARGLTESMIISAAVTSASESVKKEMGHEDYESGDEEETIIYIVNDEEKTGPKYNSRFGGWTVESWKPGNYFFVNERRKLESKIIEDSIYFRKLGEERWKSFDYTNNEILTYSDIGNLEEIKEMLELQVEAMPEYY
jgi:hypothetical protein